MAVDRESYPWEFDGLGRLRQAFAYRLGQAWECVLCGATFPTGVPADLHMRAVMYHAATRHPKATAEATGVDVEELAHRYGQSDA